jgi:hypothetical protein
VKAIEDEEEESFRGLANRMSCRCSRMLVVVCGRVHVCVCVRSRQRLYVTFALFVCVRVCVCVQRAVKRAATTSPPCTLAGSPPQTLLRRLPTTTPSSGLSPSALSLQTCGLFR